MADVEFDQEIAEIEAFLADPKKVADGVPVWIAATRKNEYQAIWGIFESSGVSRAELRFRYSSLSKSEPSVSVVFRRRLVARIDIVPPQSWKPNPPGAFALGLPARVEGTHTHSWADNRDFVRSNGFGQLPFRRPLPVAMKRLPQAIAALAAEINLTLEPDQRDFDVPTRSDLFENG